MLVNKYHIEGDVAYIELTQGQETMIDVADLERVLAYPWHTRSNVMGGYYAASRNEKGSPMYMHRFLLNTQTGESVKHLNHNTLDNRRSNLSLLSSIVREKKERSERGERGYWIEDEVAYLELTQGQVTMIDVADLEKVLQYRWYATQHEMGGYYASAAGSTYMHRFLMNAPKGMTVDHINHQTLDNRKANLRIVSNQKNNTNRNGAFSSSKTGIRGVSVHKCKPSGLMYVFKCSCVTCRACEYFPYTEQGLEDARVYAEWHFKAMENPEEAGSEPEKRQYTRVAPLVKAKGKIDALGVSIMKTRTGTYYFFRCKRKVCPTSKYFPLTDEGLEAAKAFSEAHYAALKQ